MPTVELVTLFGDDLDEVSPARIGVHVAGGAKVGARDLAAALLAMSVAELHSQGSASLAEQDVRRLLRTRRALMIASTGAGDGFAGRVAAATRTQTQATDLARQVLGGMVRTPELTVLGIAQSFLEPAGAVVRKHGLKRLGVGIGYSPFEIDPAGAERLRADWPAVRQAWESWKSANPALAGPLLAACRTSLGSARDTSEAAAIV